MNWYIGTFRKAFDFGGRARRKEYWVNYLITILVFAVLIVTERMLGMPTIGELYGPFSVCYALVALIPLLAVSFRRIHDTGRSAWWFLIGIIPVLGSIAVLVLLALDGEPGTNKYGRNPKAVDAGNLAYGD